VTAEIIDGRACAQELKRAVAVDVKEAREEDLDCGLATVQVGDNYSATAYERRLRRLAHDLDVPYF
jgi:methylenetetrahydrofolate dehydrogenase (NADP+) / methenyltetrahydrofolate cyclohydrolase